jgi:glycosyltransferase involved in cell wall biosynthesis
MASPQVAPAQDEAAPAAPAIEIVVPVYNEQDQVVTNVSRLRDWLDRCFPFTAVVTVVDNASTDQTWGLAQRLAQSRAGVHAVHLDRKGRGLALRTAWASSPAQVVAYMDVDLATGLDALLPLVAPLLSGHSDLAIGTRLARGATVVRGTQREATSRLYNLLVHVTMRSGFSDAQCGFKALRADVARALLPLVEDDGWFFDTELLVLAERNGLRIHEVPVDWVDDPRSSVHVVRTAVSDMAGLLRMLVGLAAGRGRAEVANRGVDLRSYTRLGVFSTVAWLIIFLSLRAPLGPYAANAASLLVCTLGSVAFQWRAAAHNRDLATTANVGAIGLAVSLAFTSLGLALVTAAGYRSELAEVVGLLIATAFAALARLLAAQAWLLHRQGTARGPR